MPNHSFDENDVDLENEVVMVDGKRFTDADAQSLTEELSGRERSNSNLIPGRKSLSGGAKHSPVVNVRVADDTRDTLEEVANARGVKLSQHARQALEDSVNFYVCFEQSFDNANYELVRINKPLPLEQAQAMFDHYVGIAASFRFRSVQIRQGRDVIVQSWPAA